MIKHIGQMTVAGHRGDMYNCVEYLYCDSVFATKNKAYYDCLIEKGIESWSGTGVTQEKLLVPRAKNGAKLVTCNNTKDIFEKLKRSGLR